jgi:hypothetical protein
MTSTADACGINRSDEWHDVCSTQSFAQYILVRASFGAASCELSVDDYGRQAPHALLFRAARDLVVVHVVDLDFVVGTGDLFDHFDSLLAGGAPGAEDFDFSFHKSSPFTLSRTIRSREERTPGTREPAEPASYSRGMWRREGRDRYTSLRVIPDRICRQ